MPRDFYSTVAQVLPVLLLALVWESRFLERLRGQERRLRRDDQANGVKFWTKPRVRAYSLAVTAFIVVGIGLSVLALAGAAPDGWPLRGVLIGVIVLALGTVITRIWVDVIDATTEGRADPQNPANDIDRLPRPPN